MPTGQRVSGASHLIVGSVAAAWPLSAGLRPALPVRRFLRVAAETMAHLGRLSQGITKPGHVGRIRD